MGSIPPALTPALTLSLPLASLPFMVVFLDDRGCERLSFPALSAPGHGPHEVHPRIQTRRTIAATEV